MAQIRIVATRPEGHPVQGAEIEIISTETLTRIGDVLVTDNAGEVIADVSGPFYPKLRISGDRHRLYLTNNANKPCYDFVVDQSGLGTHTTIQDALDAAYAHDAPAAIFICPGTYTEFLNTANFGYTLTMRGAGIDEVTVVAPSAADYTIQLSNMLGVDSYYVIEDMTFEGFGTNTVFGNFNGQRLHMTDVVLRPKSGGRGAQFNGSESLKNIRIEGPTAMANAAVGFDEANGGNQTIEGMIIRDCDIGARVVNSNELLWNDIRFLDCATVGLLFNSNGGAYRSNFNNILFDTCTIGFRNVCGGGSNSNYTNFIFYNCGTGVDFSSLSLAGGCGGIESSNFDNFTFWNNPASGNLGIRVNSAVRYTRFTGMNFMGYTLGNEISGTVGTGSEIFHIKSNAGSIADQGSPVGHTGLPAGTGAAPNDASYLVLGLNSNLSSERVLTPGSGLQGADAGANGAYTLLLGNLSATWAQAGAFNIYHAGALRVGSSSAPTNTTAGDVTGTRLIVPNAALLHGAVSQLGGPVVIPTGGVLRFSDADDSHYVGLRGPATAQTENWVIHLPDDDPTVGQVLAAKSVSAPNVTTEWITPSGGSVSMAQVWALI